MAETHYEYRVYTIIPRDDEPFWFQIGRAFPHAEQEGGFTLRLNALPVTPKLVIRKFEVEEASAELPGTEPGPAKPAAPAKPKPPAQKKV